MAGPQARFPGLKPGGYESFYVRAVDPASGHGLWLRHTVQDGIGNVWLTLFADTLVTDKRRGEPATDRGWIRIGDSHVGPDGIHGPGYDLTWTDTGAPPLRHLPRDWMYRAPLPKTKPESPLPDLRLSGTVTVGDTTLELDRWPGMLGHNWGAEHAERWIWLHGTAFAEDPAATLDLVLGRVRLGPVLTPWVAFGAAFGERVAGRPRLVEETPLALRLEVGGLQVTATSDPGRTAVWRYGEHHHTANCSVAALDVTAPDGRRLTSGFGGAYELGMRESTHGLPVLPFPDP